MELRVGILTVSDRVSKGVYEDLSAPEIEAVLGEHFKARLSKLYGVVPDDEREIVAALLAMVDRERCRLVLTTGGTGPAPRDVTPEATAAVCEKILPGLGEAMRAASMGAVPTAALSRQTAGVRRGALIVNLPGSPRAIRLCLERVMPAIIHCLELLGSPPPEGGHRHHGGSG